MIVLKCVILFFLISTSYCRLPDKVVCVNPECSEPISKAKTLINYNSGDPDLMSFRGNSDAIIFKKSAGVNPDIWYASINGKSGYVASKFLREYKILERNPEVILPVESMPIKVQPNKVQQAHEVIDGTTILSTEQDSTTIQSDVPPKPTESTPIDSDQVQEPLETDEKVEKELETNLDTLNKNIKNESSLTDNNENNFEAVTQSPPNVDVNNKDVDNSDELASNVNNTQIDNPIDEGLEDNSSEPVEVEVVEQLSPSHAEEEFTSENLDESHSEKDIASIASESDIPSDSVVKVPEKLDITNDNITDNTVNGEDLPTNNTNNDDMQLPVEDSHVLNKPEAETQMQNPPQVPETKSESLDSEQIVNNTLQTNSNNVIPDNINQEPPQTQLPVSTTEVPAAPETTIPELEIMPITETIPAAFDINTYENIAKPQEANSIPQSEPSTYETTPQYIETSPEITQPTTESNSEQYTESTTSTTSPPLDSTSSESIIEEIFSSNTEEYYSTPLPSNEEKSEGILSSIYTTVADMWPPATEAPPPIYNPEYVQEDTDQSFSLINYLLNTYKLVMGVREDTHDLFPGTGETCYKDEYCDGEGNKPNRLLTFLLTTAGSVLLFTLGYYYIESNRQDSRLIGNIDNLQRELLFSSKECKILKEELSATKMKLAGIEDNSFGMDDMVQSLRAEINELKDNNERLRNSLDDNEKLLRVSENTAGELQNTLSEVENTLSELFTERAHSEEQIAELNGKIQAFEEELISVSRERDNFQLKYVSAENALDDFKKQKKQLDDLKLKLSEANNTIELQRHEIVALKDAIKELQGGTPSNTDANTLIDHTEIKAKLAKALEEKNTFMTKYEAEHKERSRLTEELKTTLDSYKASSQQAAEATTRLEVLGKYFQERESELMKELSTKEALWLSKQGESTSTVEKIELMQQEVQRYKEKCDQLTLELAEAESSRRTCVGELEGRAHAAWLEARTACRDLEAARADAAALRRKLAALRDPATTRPAVASPLEAEASLPAGLAPGLGPGLPPLAFLPPLLPPLPRPPPLGRLPSPPRFSERPYSPDSRYSPASYYPPERRYSPDRRHSPDSRYSPEAVRYSPESRYSPASRRSPYSTRRRRSIERYYGPGSRRRNGPADTETEYNSDSPGRRPSRRRYSRQSGPSSGSGCSSESEK